MDQVNGFLKVLKRHYFWFLTLIVVIAGLGTWFYATGSLRAEYEDNKSKITSAQSSITQIRSEANHPNDSSNAEMQKRIDGFVIEIRDVWRTLYKNQEDNTLVWPKELKPDFINKVKPLRPIEAKIDYPTPTSQEISSNFTERYRDYIKEELPKLADIIQSEWLPSATGGGGAFGDPGRFGQPPGGREFGGAAGLAPQKELIVLWNAQNQAQLQQERFDWSLKPGKVPSTLEVLYAQEDLWVLQTIMGIIARTNGGVQAHHRATIKEIESIHMGRNAVGLMGKVQRLQSTSTGDDFFGGELAAPIESATPMPLERGEQGAVVDPAMYRYVDPQNMPIAADTLRDALRNNSPDTAFLSVAKRLPVRMRLIMDQRKIHKLLAECGSAPLTIEVRQVRVNREAGVGGSSGFSGGSIRGGEGRGPGGVGGSGSSQTDVSSTYDVPVEVYGVVYIFNPPNDDILKLSENQLAEAAASVSPITQPAVAEPVAAAPAAAPPAAAEPAAAEPAAAEPVPPAAEPAPAAVPVEPPAAEPAAAPADAAAPVAPAAPN